MKPNSSQEYVSVQQGRRLRSLRKPTSMNVWFVGGILLLLFGVGAIFYLKITRDAGYAAVSHLTRAEIIPENFTQTITGESYAEFKPRIAQQLKEDEQRYLYLDWPIVSIPLGLGIFFLILGVYQHNQ